MKFLTAEFNMAILVHILVCFLITLFVACSCIPIKPQSPEQGATDECYGTNCYYDDLDFTTDTTVNVNFPENLTTAVMSSLPIIESSQRKTVDLLNGTLVFFQESLLAAQNKAVVLQEKNSASQDATLILLNKTVALLEKNGQHLENIEAILASALRNVNNQQNLTAPTDQPRPEEDILQNEVNTQSSESLTSTFININNQQNKNVTLTATDEPRPEEDNLQNQMTTQSSELPPARDCQDIAARGIDNSGPYVISPPDGLGSFEVYCDLATGNEGWTVFQRRFDGSVDFYRNWTDYEQGFGDASGEYWLGLKNIRRLISEGTTWALQIDLESFHGETAHVVYDSFQVSDAASNYTLSVGAYSGNGGDSLKYSGITPSGQIHNGMPFSTFDRDNDAASRNCAQIATGAWWYNTCLASNLNGQYLESSNTWEGMVWYTWKRRQSLKSSQMKMRRTQ